MKAMNFYTANGWAGSNYDSKLSTKEIAAKVRSYAKKNFPDFKFSVRSEWSMYTDSMYIELKEGTCIPFVEGSRSAERGYMSTMSTVKGWENELTPEMFKVLDAVTTYASSFRYDDSDGMQDYYDTNFYLKIKVSDEYKVVEPKAKKAEKPSYESKSASDYDKGDGKVGNYPVPTHTSYSAANLYNRLKNNRHFGFKYGLPSEEIMKKLKDYKGNVKVSEHNNAGTIEIYRIKFT
jgi:hypothetical protein